MLSERGATRPGRLRLRAVLEARGYAPDGAGGSAIAWAAGPSLFADVTPLKAEERVVNEATEHRVTHKVVVRYRTDLQPGDRLRAGTRAFRILTLRDPDETRRYLACQAVEEPA